MSRNGIFSRLAVLLLLGASGAMGAEPANELQYHEYTDPAEHAFADLAPNGWRVGGLLVRYGPITIAPFVQAMPPNGSIFIQLGDWNIKDYADIPGWREGALYTPGTSIEFVHRLRTPEQYAGEYITRFEEELGCGQSESMGTAKSPNPPGLATVPQASVGTVDAQFGCVRDGQHFIGHVMVSLQAYRLPMGTVGWGVVYLASFLARQDSADQGLAVWNKMRGSFHFLPDWNTREAMIAREATRPAMEGLQRTLAAAQSFDQHVINGTITVHDPTTGAQSEIPMGVAPFYFSDGNGHFYSSYDPTARPGFHSVKTVK